MKIPIVRGIDSKRTRMICAAKTVHTQALLPEGLWSLSFSISFPIVTLSLKSRNPLGCCLKKLRTTSSARRASSGVVVVVMLLLFVGGFDSRFTESELCR